MKGSPRTAGWLVVLFLISTAGCQTIREVTQLRKVDFRIDRVTEAQLAGIPLDEVRSPEDLNARQVLRLSQALAAGELPLSFTLHVMAENPPKNSVNARLTQMDWTLLLEEQETISGVFNQNIVLPPGEPKDIAVPMQLDLVRFFNDNLPELVRLAQAVAGDGEAQTVALRVQPTINTVFGPITYPDPITVVRREVGGSSDATP